MNEMARLDNPNGSPFIIGDRQMEWLKRDLPKLSEGTPIAVFSHSPLQSIYQGWNFWIEEAEVIRGLLKPYQKANVTYGHVHQIQYNQIGNVACRQCPSGNLPEISEATGARCTAVGDDQPVRPQPAGR